ncbi:ABC transporter permease [Chloroflexales bacterium ZM16-3]|nr:ABC transporter permease [Chloroflexales bacterium ZM16-3]
MPERRRGITRRQVIAGFFILVGLLLLVAYVPQLGAEKPSLSKLSFGVPGPVLPLPTALSEVVIAIIYLVSGALALVPRTESISTWLLWVSAVLLFPAILIWAAEGKQTNAVIMVSEALRLGTPIALGALAGIYAERSGVVNIAIEGMMLTGAAFGFTAYAATGNIWLGVVVAVLFGGLIALIHGLLSISLKVDQIISGTVINILAIGVTGYMRRQFMVNEGSGLPRLPSFAIPGLADIPIIGPMLFEGQPIFFVMLVLVVVTHIVFFYTRWGLRTRAVGENPRAADTVGINVSRMRYINVMISGMIAGLGGAWFSLETVGKFDDGMTAGKGFIALAAMIFGKWMPFGSFGGAMLFGFSEALGTRFQILNVKLFGGPVPIQFLQMLPYVLTIVVLAGLIGRAVGPAAAGKPYEK